MTDDPAYWSIGQAARALREGQVSARELTEMLLARIVRLDPTLNAYCHVAVDAAREAADRADGERAEGLDRGPLHGVPLAVKDLCYTLDAPTAFGTKLYRDWMAPFESTVTARLREAGAVMLGKLAMTEGATLGYHPDLPRPVNPWAADRWTGVSSSGPAVAIAAGLCFGAIGSDTGGSIRVPAAACGLTGLKPTWGRVSRHGIVPLSATYDHIGPMARSVEDVAVLFGATAGADPSDPIALRAPVPDYRQALDTDVRGLRIGIDEAALADVAPAVRAALDHFAETLVEAGASLRRIASPDPAGIEEASVAIISSELAAAHIDFSGEKVALYGPALGGFVAHGRSVDGMTVARAYQKRTDFAARIDALFEDIEILLCPVLDVPVPLAAEVPEGPAPSLGRSVLFANITGSPSLALPAGIDGNGMPIGIQIVGGHLSEPLLFAVGHRFQQQTQWHLRRPPLDLCA